MRNHYKPDEVDVAIDWSSLRTYPTDGNLWDVLFHQPYAITSSRRTNEKVHVETISYFPGDFTNLSGVTDYGGDIRPEILAEGRRLVKKFIRVKDSILEKAIEFVKMRMSGFRKILAVHIRRTDKVSESHLNFMLDYEDFRVLTEEHMKLFDYDGYFLCSDDQKLKAYMAKASGSLCMTYDSLLSSKQGFPVHFDTQLDGYRKAEDVLVEVLCMASCAGLLSTISNVANSVLFFGNEGLPANHFYFHNLARMSPSFLRYRTERRKRSLQPVYERTED
eukprot:CAMPEP_0167775772 /NCGR_PEP_ID=MMETSP0111_2-20121227/2747_1 /TAXON_ID=91324 /ORGANISM="Lotharella globosa, Strain CCCM811" /LENGTH=276 /DNA_ID=CAMNT_0007665729 /DNA_START=393 /DNA_END=1223 /DNA_ORIENTATION=+